MGVSGVSGSSFALARMALPNATQNQVNAAAIENEIKITDIEEGTANALQKLGGGAKEAISGLIGDR